MRATDYRGRRSDPLAASPSRIADESRAPRASTVPLVGTKEAATVGAARRGSGLRECVFFLDGQSGGHPEGLPAALSTSRRVELIGACLMLGTFLAMALLGG